MRHLIAFFVSASLGGCAPASASATQLVLEAQDKRIFAIAWHVDYWDYLGWKDLFAKPTNTLRQSTYARLLGDGRNYTPQTVVNGRATIAGTDRAKLDGLLRDALARPTSATVTLDFAPQAATDAVQVGWKVAGAQAGSRLTLVLVERGIATAVARGENAGKTLAHAPVARATAEADPVAGAGTTSLTAPAGMVWERAGVVALLQDPTSMAIEAAASLDLQASP